MWFMEGESSRLRPHCAICERMQSSSWRDALSDNYLPCANIWSADGHPKSFILSLGFSDYLMYPQEMRRFDLSGICLLMTWQASCSLRRILWASWIGPMGLIGPIGPIHDAP